MRSKAGALFLSLAACAGGTARQVQLPTILGHALPTYTVPARHDTPAPELDRASSEPVATLPRAAVTLPQVIEATVLTDPRIRAAFATVLRARADRLRAGVFDNPSISLSQTLNPLPGHSFTPTRQGGPPQLDVGISYSLERLLFGQRRAGMEAADRQIDAELAAYAGVARERVLQAIGSYVDALETRELARLASDQVAQLLRLESITARRVALGSVGQVELSRVHIAAINGRRRALSAQVERDNALTRLRTRLGQQYLDREVEAADSLDLTPRSAPPFASLLTRALKMRPELLEQERRVAAAQAAEKRELRLAMPKLNVGVGYTRQFQERAIGYPNASSWGASLQTTLPFFDRNQGGVAVAQAAIFEAEATLTSLRLEVRSEVEQALRSLLAAAEILASFDSEAMEAAESARNTIEEAYALGGRTLLELLDAQQVYRDVYREHVIARAEYLRAVHRLNAVVGEEVFP